MDINLITNDDKSVLRLSDIEKYKDGSGYGTKITVHSSGFGCTVFCDFSEDELDKFIKQLESCDKNLSGEAKLKTEYYYWYIKFQCNK